MSLTQLWIEQYRPQSIEDYVFYDTRQRTCFLDIIKTQSIPNLLLYGPAGCGKSLISELLVSECGLDAGDVLKINASDENSIDVIRDKVKSFVNSYALGTYKVVRLEEFDRMSPQAQDALRDMMEECSNVARFILTANYESRITSAIKSRCQQYRFKSSPKSDIITYAESILVSENVSYTRNNVEKYVDITYPDIRSTIQLIQQNTINNKLLNPEDSANTASDYRFDLLDLIEADQWIAARKLCCENVMSEDWEGVYRFLYENLNKSKKFKTRDNWEAGIVIIAQHLYENMTIADPEIGAAAMFIKLGQI